MIFGHQSFFSKNLDLFSKTLQILILSRNHSQMLKTLPLDHKVVVLLNRTNLIFQITLCTLGPGTTASAQSHLQLQASLAPGPMTASQNVANGNVLINGFPPNSATSAAIHSVYSTLLLLFSLHVRSGQVQIRSDQGA